jgi:hypothetical protein
VSVNGNSSYTEKQKTPILLSTILQPDQKKGVAAASGLFVDRRPTAAIANTEYYRGNHWQRGEGYIGAKPLVMHGPNQTWRQLEEGFVSENVIAEVVDRHVGGILGREPLWGFVPQFTVSQRTLSRRRRFSKLFNVVFDAIDTAKGFLGKSVDVRAQEADEALTLWWDHAKPRKQLKLALARCLNEDRALLRMFVPRGLYQNRTVPLQPNLSSALNLLHIEVVSSDKGGVFIDTDTQKPFGLYVYKVNNSQCIELSYVNELGLTIHQILSDDPALVVEPVPYEMQGRLWMHEIERKALITEQIRSNQKSLNLALTMMVRNVNLAGNLERVIMNAERPKRKIRRVDGTSPTGYREETIDSDWLTGPGVSNLLSGLLIRDDDGKIIGRANPNISYHDPVRIDTFVGTREECRECILGQSQQLHIMISGDSTVSGRSREQARAEYRASLQDSKEPLDDAGRWALEAPLRIAAQFCGRVRDFQQLRCDFDSRIEESQPSADDKRVTVDLVKSKLISRETGMMTVGIEDTDAELQKIAEEEAANPALNPPPPPEPKPTNGDSELLQ